MLSPDMMLSTVILRLTLKQMAWIEWSHLKVRVVFSRPILTVVVAEYYSVETILLLSPFEKYGYATE